jgi:hypothetical protein
MDTGLATNSGCDGASGSAMNHTGKQNGFAVIRVILGTLLLVAAGLKLANGDFGAVGGFGSFVPPLWRLVVVAVEALLGIWLLLGLVSRFLWLAALLFFSALAGVSLYLGVDGQPSCGCFGPTLPVQPWYIAALDSCAVAALLFWRPVLDFNNMPWFWFRGTAKPIVGTIILLGVIGGMVAAVFGHADGVLTSNGMIIEDGKVVVLQPATWVGKRFPLLPYIETDENLSAGEWLLLLIHSDCPKCREVLPRFEQLAKDRVARGMPSRVVVIELPPYDASVQSGAAYPEKLCKSGRLTQQKEWFAKTPTLIKTVDGLVIEVDTVVRP